jgi:ribosomal protein S18 acetylase RimI-like enzyme
MRRPPGPGAAERVEQRREVAQVLTGVEERGARVVERSGSVDALARSREVGLVRADRVGVGPRRSGSIGERAQFVVGGHRVRVRSADGRYGAAVPPTDVRPLGADDRPWVDQVTAEMWGLPVVSPSGVFERPADLEGLVARRGDERVGFVTWSVDAGAWEVVVLAAVLRRVGVGRALMEAVRARAVAARASRVWLVTTDDNPGAVAFYAAIGMARVRTWTRFVDHVRAVKPALPPDAFRDAIELEWPIAPG